MLYTCTFLRTGVYSSKQDYKNRFLPLISRVRKEFHGGWTPNTLADETREARYGRTGYGDDLDWLERDVHSHGGTLSKWKEHPCYVEIWFEAAAMGGRFRDHTKYVTACPLLATVLQEGIENTKVPAAIGCSARRRNFVRPICAGRL